MQVTGARRWKLGRAVIGTWAARRLDRQLSLAIAACLAIASIVFLVMLIGLYRARLLEERSEVAAQVNGLLRITLENAMLKRDIDGLRQIVDRLGSEERVASVLVLDPGGEVRFASDPSLLGRRLSRSTGEICADCEDAPAPSRPTTGFVATKDREVLRSIIPVRNREACAGCHGRPDSHPVNGILVVDYDAAGIRHSALLGAAILAGAGVLVVGAVLVVLWLIVRRVVLRPIRALSRASLALSGGDLSVRAGLIGDDEIAALGRSFDAMAERLQASLRDVEAREKFLQSLIDSIPDGVRVIDERFSVVRANRAFLDQVRLPAESVLGRPCYVSSHGRDAPCAATLVTCPVVELADDGRSLICRHRHLRSDGTDFHVEVSAAALSPANGGGRLVIESIRDLTREMNISQEQRLSEIGLLAAGVAHEIRNPLTSLKLYLKGFERMFGRQAPPGSAVELAAMEHEIDACIDITERLLKLSAPPGRRRELVSLNAVIPEVLSLLKAEAAVSGIIVTVALADGLRVIAADSDMRTLIFNLAQNAFHAMPRGGRLDIVGSVRADQIQIVFVDSGVGIRSEDLGRIFDPFWSRRADGRRGTGLGLSICSAILRGFGGRIEAQSELGLGARFVISMPWADRQDEAA